MITQFLGHIVRGEPIKLVDGGTQKRAFTYIDDGIAALMKIIANDGGIASGKIYNIGNPANNYSVRELAHDDARPRADAIPNTATPPRKVDARRDDGRRVLRQGLPGRAEPRAEDRQHHAPTSTGRRRWPWTTRCARIFDAYRGQVAEARGAASTERLAPPMRRHASP